MGFVRDWGALLEPLLLILVGGVWRSLRRIERMSRMVDDHERRILRLERPRRWSA